MGVNISDGRYHCFRCGYKGRASDGSPQLSPRHIARLDDPALAERKRERLRRTWRDSLPLSHPKAHAVRSYLESRALGEVLKSPPPPLRAHPGLSYWDGFRELGTYPAMIALFNGADGTPATLHVTWLRSDGCAKACVPSPKKILGVPVPGATKGGSIRLYGPREGVLGVAEGIESALSLHLLKKIPTWASFCADNLVRIQLPTGIRELYIGVDNDSSGKGEAVAQQLANRVLRWKRKPQVYFVKPEGAAPCDLNDELRQRRSS
jgi:putative DNA primase/helicase